MILEIVHVSVDAWQPFGAPWKSDAVARHGVPVSHRLQLTALVVARSVLQHRRVVKKRINIPVNNKINKMNVYTMNALFIP